jgi:hypothetical protein
VKYNSYPPQLRDRNGQPTHESQGGGAALLSKARTFGRELRNLQTANGSRRVFDGKYAEQLSMVS